MGESILSHVKIDNNNISTILVELPEYGNNKIIVTWFENQIQIITLIFLT